MGRQVDGDITCDEVFSGPGIALAVTQRHANAREELGGIERLHYIIVGTQVESGDFFVGRVACGENNGCNACSLEDRQELEAVTVRQAEVK